MKSFTNDDFIRLLEDLDDNYGDEEYGAEPEEFVWSPARASYKKKIKLPTTGGFTDLTNVRKEKIKDMLCKNTVFQIGIFIIRITGYSSDTDNKKQQDLKLKLSFLHEVTKTPSGAPCKMQYKFDIGKDKRFTNCSWLNYLIDSNTMKDVPINEAVEIVRWFQGIHRMTAFL